MENSDNQQPQKQQNPNYGQRGGTIPPKIKPTEK